MIKILKKQTVWLFSHKIPYLGMSYPISVERGVSGWPSMVAISL